MENNKKKNLQQKVLLLADMLFYVELKVHKFKEKKEKLFRKWL